MRKNIVSLCVLALVISLVPVSSVGALDLAERLGGYILLQVEGSGEAWYVHPEERMRYYMKDGSAAYGMMRSFGLGITNTDLNKIPVGIDSRFEDHDQDGDGLSDKMEEAMGTDVNNVDSDGDGHGDGAEVEGGYNPLGSGKIYSDHLIIGRVKGRILLQVEDRGQAWYVNPKDGKRYYMKDGQAAFAIMRFLSLGITDNDLDRISRNQIELAGMSLDKFKSAGDFDDYIAGLEEEAEEADVVDAYASPLMIGEGVADLGLQYAEKSEPTESESITNVQEAGVDEGDIVKAYEDYLVILRRGRLFSIALKDAGGDVLTPISKVNVYPQGMTGYHTWYDEMLIYENKIIVVGYSYGKRATEIGIFTVDNNGVIRHQSTNFLDSNDYYSSRNYTSRLIGNKLIFYIPNYLYYYAYIDGVYAKQQVMPKLKKWMGNNEVSDGRPILAKTEIYMPVQKTYSPTLHTIVTCDLDKKEFDCTSKAILGPPSRTYYVSPDAVYIWVSGGSSWYYRQHQRVWHDYSYVYRFSLEDETVGVLKADGSPIDQFSFKESADGYLNVLVRDDGYGDAMWSPERSYGNFALLRVPLDKFSRYPKMIESKYFTKLPGPSSYSIQNKFIGDHLLYGSQSWYYSSDDIHSGRHILYTKKITDNSGVQTSYLTHSVDRIEALGGSSAVIIGSGSGSLKFTSFDLGGGVEEKDVFELKHTAQGEWRSHGFFYKPQTSGTGIIGLPTRTSGYYASSLYDDSAAVTYLGVSADKQFSDLGELKAGRDDERSDDCVVSCVDWYGNSRPIFYGGRIFALMGYELVEGEYQDEAISEVRRVIFNGVIPTVRDDDIVYE